MIITDKTLAVSPITALIADKCGLQQARCHFPPPIFNQRITIICDRANFTGYLRSDAMHGELSCSGEKFLGSLRGNQWNHWNITERGSGRNKSHYIGETQGGVKEGWGIFTRSTQVYEGEWKADKQEGWGRMAYSDGTYEGIWKGGFRVEGEMAFNNGAHYKGQWDEELFHGTGTLTAKNGNVYNGDFYKGEMDGKGTLNFTNGDFYKGEWFKNNFHGKGVFERHRKPKLIYNGTWVQGQRKGLGLEIDQYGDEFFFCEQNWSGQELWDTVGCGLQALRNFMLDRSIKDPETPNERFIRVISLFTVPEQIANRAYRLAKATLQYLDDYFSQN